MLPSEHFRKNARTLRSLYGVTQAEVAARIGLDDSVYGRIEAGVRKITLDEASSIADAFHVPLGTLLAECSWQIRAVAAIGTAKA